MVINTETLFWHSYNSTYIRRLVWEKMQIQGVIDKNNNVFNYKKHDGMRWKYDISKSTRKSSLSITAITERAMSLIPPKQ